MGGAEFAIIAESLDRSLAEQLSKGLSDVFSELGRQTGIEGIAHIGGIAFDPLGTTDSIMSAARESYNKARLVGLNSFVIGETSTGARTKDEWIELVRSVVDQGLADIVISDRAEALQGADAGEILLEEATARLETEDGGEISIGTFISVAEEIDMATDFDLMILRKAFDYLRIAGGSHGIGVNLSFSSIGNPDFRSQLYSMIEKNKDITSRLVFCLTAYAAAKDLKLLASFKDLIMRTGTKLMIKRYEPRFMELDVLKKYQFNYIRLARSYTEELAADVDKRNLVSTMVETGNILNSTILAENVGGQDWRQVIDLGVHGASRK